MESLWYGMGKDWQIELTLFGLVDLCANRFCKQGGEPGLRVK